MDRHSANRKKHQRIKKRRHHPSRPLPEVPEAIPEPERAPTLTEIIEDPSLNWSEWRDPISYDTLLHRAVKENDKKSFIKLIGRPEVAELLNTSNENRQSPIGLLVTQSSRLFMELDLTSPKLTPLFDPKHWTRVYEWGEYVNHHCNEKTNLLDEKKDSCSEHLGKIWHFADDARKTEIIFTVLYSIQMSGHYHRADDKKKPEILAAYHAVVASRSSQSLFTALGLACFHHLWPVIVGIGGSVFLMAAAAMGIGLLVMLFLDTSELHKALWYSASVGGFLGMFLGAKPTRYFLREHGIPQASHSFLYHYTSHRQQSTGLEAMFKNTPFTSSEEAQSPDGSCSSDTDVQLYRLSL